MPALKILTTSVASKSHFNAFILRQPFSLGDLYAYTDAY